MYEYYRGVLNVHSQQSFLSTYFIMHTQYVLSLCKLLFHLIILKHYNDVMVIVFSIEMMVFSIEFNKGGRGRSVSLTPVISLYYLNEPMKCDINEGIVSKQLINHNFTPKTTQRIRSCLGGI